MKKLTCFVNDSKLLDKITSFCEKERFQLEALAGSDKFVYDAAIVLYITDDKSRVAFPELRDIPVCFVGHSKPDSACTYYINSNLDYIHLRCLVDAVTHSGCFETAAAAAEPVSLSKVFRICNDIFSIEKIVYALTKDFVYFLDFQALEKVRVGLSEMLTNAIEHGNLGITGDEKLEATEAGTYYDLVNRRLVDKECSQRVVTFSYKVDNTGIDMEIEDEGAGFDVDSLPDPTDPESLLKLHGRGILITRMYFDEVIYNEKGNKVTLTKRF